MLYEDSRYLTTYPYSANKSNVVLSRRVKKKYNAENCEVYTVQQGDTLESISYEMYNNVSYWWAILDANPKYQNEMEVNVGDSLLIPQFDEVVVGDDEQE
jgi:nucleoid-associated protein YgaU